MKELSIEQKAKAYDEALDNAKVVYKTIRKDLKPVIEQIFPELKESEDERIRKELIGFLKEEEAKADITSKRSKTLCKYISWLEKQVKQETADEVEDVRTTGYWHVEDVEQKPAWSVEDEKMFNNICIDIVEYIPKSFEENSKKVKWLKSLKDRIHPQPKQVWSKEDERNLEGIIDEIEVNKNQAPDYDIATYDRFLSWLKSLRPQNTWKPSDEQIEAVRIAIGDEQGSDCCDILRSLLKDLKSL